MKTKKQSVRTRAFLCGWAAALADLNRGHDQPTMVEDVMHGAGVTVTDLKSAGVDPYDLNEIKKCMTRRRAAPLTLELRIGDTVSFHEVELRTRRIP